jgi:hypothetical protein
MKIALFFIINKEIIHRFWNNVIIVVNLDGVQLVTKGLF